MPFSQTSQLTPIVAWSEQLSPRSVLDVGIGMGQYGFLLRTKLEALNLFHIEGDKGWLNPRSEWRIRIDGVEGFAGYITPVQEWAYNQIIIDDALKALSKIDNGSYELVIAIDILEHFSTQDGLRLLDEMKRVSSRAVLISTPKDFIEQKVPANPLENHLSLWGQEDLFASGYSEIVPNEESWIAVWKA